MILWARMPSSGRSYVSCKLRPWLAWFATNLTNGHICHEDHRMHEPSYLQLPVLSLKQWRKKRLVLKKSRSKAIECQEIIWDPYATSQLKMACINELPSYHRWEGFEVGRSAADPSDREDRDAQITSNWYQSKLEELGQLALNLVLASSYWKVKMFNRMGQVIKWIGWSVNSCVLEGLARDRWHILKSCTHPLPIYPTYISGTCLTLQGYGACIFDYFISDVYIIHIWYRNIYY